ncbi:hypothetical protein TRFO_19947 [Tritrichomonas foetus]|uniref:Leucine Rich Repeat family protein n=1 Tax=Tritrichomonas foetus TaxID=1144522 RepID=A0A1J4KH29_9EUKA|nr:hypothetical protein TRFO_19947 [Tritrichomonas foetus]|eukprot:OHT10719.1 hypothetical protein TRFO_19947 [Tritrichomonas foetus]
MLSNIILDLEKDPEIVDTEGIFKYEGKKDLKTLKSLEAIADTREMSLTFLGDYFPSLQKLRLNNSIIPSIRDISSSLSNLRFLSLAHCKLTNLDGIATISPQLEELYLAYNKISDIFELMSLNKLVVLDMEQNRLPDIESISLLNCCSALRALTLIGNPCSESGTYRQDVMEKIPQVVYLDEKRLRPKVKTPTKTSRDSQVSTPTSNSTPNSNIIQSNDPSCKHVQENSLLSRAHAQSALSHTPTGTKSIALTLTPDKKVSIMESPVIVKLQKGEKCGIKPKSSLSGCRNENKVMSEQLEDMVNNRPPTARGYLDTSSKSDFPSIKQKPSTKKIFTPQIKRPVSSFRSSRLADLE